ncbi:hypothetical protein Tsubulata_026565 [Turnera subulata]|uniref:Phosphoribosylglycinamide synthetase ATP-grasp (A) domain-containing protein n=1 Tax=Turnera subulata TaxID=218843 RepID=A0A9Q0FY69_9ROSI|nr:hypothetical protein Tsubulata_026565 [Turnera subulata]
MSCVTSNLVPSSLKLFNYSTKGCNFRLPNSLSSLLANPSASSAPFASGPLSADHNHLNSRRALLYARVSAHAATNTASYGGDLYFGLVRESLCDKYGIPIAKDQGAPIVVKADGLAAGKGVVDAMKLEEAFEAVDSMLVKSVFGSAGCRVIIEDFLEGEEASFFALVDGENGIPLESAQDHKRA